MDNNEIIDTLRAFLLQDFPNQAVELGNETDLLNEWFVDSLGIIETVLFLEKRFGVKMKRADINGDNFRNLNTLAAFVADHLSQ